MISLVDDVLIEQMRKCHCDRIGEPYEAIADRDADPRARRITAYLNLLDRLVREQVVELQASPFEPGSEITRYFDLLPETALKQAYRDMQAEADPAAKARMQDALRPLAVPGAIDVNIMTKLDQDVWRNGEKREPEARDALAALRGFALSTVRSSMVFSAGLNQRLFRYAAEFEDFFPDASGFPKKGIILKVSDFRSAQVQGRFLAKLGLWVSEYRIESGLNCGGHAFATKGFLMGPILDEFRESRVEMFAKLRDICIAARRKAGRPESVPPEPRITAQGGISTPVENECLLKHYEVDGTGWGTPFLLVPEVVTIDDEHLEKLRVAGDDDIALTDASPLGVPFWNLLTSASEQTRLQRIAEGRPGVACRKSYVLNNTEVTDKPVCVASRTYQKGKLAALDAADMPEAERQAAKQAVVDKDCICHQLGDGAVRVHGILPDTTPALCPGPNIAGFSRISTFSEMVDYIYGRLSGTLLDPDRPHMFVTELRIYVERLRKEVEEASAKLPANMRKYYNEFKENLLSGVESYQRLAQEFLADAKAGFLGDLAKLVGELEQIAMPAMEPAV
ncbi:hypothetical protein HQ560_15705 [bacterium]|nr:hypothetical protein [bacterium]